MCRLSYLRAQPTHILIRHSPCDHSFKFHVHAVVTHSLLPLRLIVRNVGETRHALPIPIHNNADIPTTKGAAIPTINAPPAAPPRGYPATLNAPRAPKTWPCTSPGTNR